MTTRRIATSLLSLPDEHLSAIFSEVVDDDPAHRAVALVSTCRRLAPIVRQEVYRELRVGGDATEARLLSELCAKRPDLRALVQVLHLQRTVEFDVDGEMTYDYTDEHPGNALTRSHFPALHALSVLEAAPVDILRILSRVSPTTSPGIRKLTLEFVPDPIFGVAREHREMWWHLLARIPRLEDLTLSLISLDFMVRIVSDDEGGLSPLQNLHSLTIDGVPWDPVRWPTLAVLFPNLKRLRLHYGSSTELETLLRHAPTSLTQLTLWLIRDLTLILQSDVLARFPLLERLCLRKIDGKVLLPSIRKSRIRYIRLSHKAEFTDEIMLDLVDGPARVKHLKAIQLDSVSLDGNRWGRLTSAFRRDQQYDLAQVKATLSPKWPQGCSAEGLRAVMDAAHKNGIKVYGEVVDCLDWNDRFDEQVERYLVDDALASNDYTKIERYLGEEGAGKAILRQRPRLADLIRKGTRSPLRSNRLAPVTSSSDPIRLAGWRPRNSRRRRFWLPEELLELVVEQAPAESLPALLQTCRRLTRIARKRLYARIKYGGEVERHGKLVDLLEMRPDLHELVKDVTITSVFTRGDRGAGDHYGYPGTDRTLVRFPSLSTLRIVGASLSQVTQILAASSEKPLPPLQHVAIELLAAEWSRFSKFAWWEALARFPDLGKLTLHGRPNPRRRGFEHTDPGDRSRVPATLENIHTLTIHRLPAPTGGTAAFADDFPALTSLTLKDRESMVSRWLSIAPLSLTHITLWVMETSQPGELARQLGRFPRLQHLRLVGNFALKDFIPFLRTDKLRHLELHYDTTCDLADDLEPLLDLIRGPDRIRHLQSIQLPSDSDHCQTSHEVFRDCLRNVIKGTANYDLAVTDLKLDYDPFHGLSTAEDVRRLVEAARSNGINIAGSGLRCLNWEERFEDLLECCFVEHALETNDFTLLDRQYGKEGANEVIGRQRPLLAARFPGDRS